jgi:hypothetical protein
MAFVEDSTVFLQDFGVTVTSGAVSGLGILDMPGTLVADGMIITTDYTLRCEASKYGGLIYGAAVTVDGVNYQVRENRLIDDGKFCEITLLKVAPDSSAVGQDPRTFGLADLSDVDVTGAAPGDNLVYDGTNWVDANVPKAITIGNPQVGDSITIFYTQVPTTVSNVRALVLGVNPSVTFDLRYDADRGTAGNSMIVPETVTNSTFGEPIAVVNQPLAAGQYVWIEITAVSGTVNELNVSLEI